MAEENKKFVSFSERKTAEQVGKVTSDVQKLLSDKLKNRSNRQVLVDKFIIREAARPDVFAQRGQSLGKLLESRAPKAKLMQLNVIKEEGGDAVAPLPTISSTRDKLAAIMGGGSPSKSAMSRHLPMDPEERKQRSAKIQEARSVLTPFMLSRPTPEKLVQQKVITDIGDLPSHDELKDQGFVSSPQLVASLQDQKIDQVACGWGHSAVVNDKGKMSTFGCTLNGRLGHGNQSEKWVGTPEVVKFLSAIGRVSHIDCGDNHSAAVANHILYTWGAGSWGRLGLGDARDAHSPMPVKDELVNHKVVAVACGAYHTLALTKDNKVFAFGWNKNGRLGLGAEAARAENLTQVTPVLIPSLSSVVAISAALDFSLAINDQGQLFSWGCGRSGALGHADAKDTLEPRAVAALAGVKVKSVVSGAAHTLAVTEDGKLYSFGENRSGQLGRDTSVIPGPVPTQVAIDGAVVAAAAGKAHSIAVLADGSVWSWGGGNKGVLGHGTEDNVTAPKKIEALSGVKIVNATCGWVHTVLLSEEGRVYAFGTREYGKLGV